jgi:membrane protease YdiL (CAAX protease family)
VLSDKFSSDVALAISGVVFGLLHAVTPVYALLAGAASVFFGYLYNVSGNLAVPMICHAVYDVGALMWAHWTVTGLSTKEQNDILTWGPGAL